MNQAPPPLPPPDQPPLFSRGCLAAISIGAGIILLLPGLCTEAFWKGEYHKPDFPFPSLPAVVFAIEFTGAALIVVGIVMVVLRLAPPQGSRIATAFLVLAILIVVSVGLTMILLALVR